MGLRMLNKDEEERKYLVQVIQVSTMYSFLTVLKQYILNKIAECIIACLQDQGTEANRMKG